MNIAKYLKVILSLSIACSVASTKQSSADIRGAFQPVFYVENEDLARFVTAVGLIFSLRSPENFYLQDAEQANFLFISLKGLIVDKKIQASHLDMFDDGVRAEIVSQPADSDECFVQQFRTSTGRIFVLALNEASNGPEEIDRKCFLLGLSFFDSFHFATETDFNKLDVPELTHLVLGRLKAE